MPPLTWRAHAPDLYFYCDKCGQWLLEGNPLRCPHNFEILGGPPTGVYDPKRDGPIENIGEVLRECGYEHLADEIEGKA